MFQKRFVLQNIFKMLNKNYQINIAFIVFKYLLIKQNYHAYFSI